MTFASALYAGTVMHHRLRPRRHYLRYRMFWTLLDLDEVAQLDRSLALFGHNRFNLISFHDRDHGDGSATPLRAQIDRRLAEFGICLDGGAIRLLAMPRMLGYVFNPISIYFCHRRDASLAALLYEVHNTFGERHSYLFPIDHAANGERHGCAKAFHVSPFLGLDMAYEFRTRLAAKRVTVAITGRDAEGALITAALTGRRAPLTSRRILQALATLPFLTIRVIVAIHWHALCLWLKGLRVHRKPPPPSRPVTIADPRGRT